MPHVDPDLLALHALGEPVPADSMSHLGECDVCSKDLAALLEVVSVGRSIERDDVLISPPPAVWDRIAAATGVDPATISTSRHTTSPESAEPDTSPEPPPRSRGGWWQGRWVLAAAVAGLAVGAGGVAGWQALDGDADEPAVAATTDLSPLVEAGQPGTASVVDRNGSRELIVNLSAAPEVDGYLEVWLLTPDASGLVSLGVLPGDTVVIPLPDGLDLAEFPVVDISVEPFDGDPAHSGDSLVRGEFADV